MVLRSLIPPSLFLRCFDTASLFSYMGTHKGRAKQSRERVSGHTRCDALGATLHGVALIVSPRASQCVASRWHTQG
jgi:hypothetical protein